MWLLALAWTVATQVDAQTFRDRLANAREASLQPAAQPPALPEGARRLSDLAYGDDPRQRFDVYLPAQAQDAPVILYAHGGGWAYGNKDNPGTIENKAAYWLPKGYVLVSMNYRMRPDTAPLDQARDVARALAEVQKLAPQWRADPARVVLMGHSAGAHLVALIGASESLWKAAGAQRPLGVISLDSGALDVPAIMRAPRLPPLYTRAFGDDPDDWVAVSPWHQLDRHGRPMLIVCSSQRGFPSSPCDEGRKFAQKATSLGVPMQVLPEPMGHGAINHGLGAASDYTEAVAAWLRELLR
ncbi:esterase [Pseudoxanthomonas kalamensis DSM 18571]|nr:esterase [Pseudoxanthomonas kalamensis DSM 18571]